MPATSLVRRTPLAGRLAVATLAAATVATAGTVAGCSSGDVIVVSTGSQTKSAADHVTVSDAWVKASPLAMTAVFARLTNRGDAAVRLTAVTTTAADSAELHETVADGSGGMTMRPKAAGFEIPAGDSHDLAPGGDHIMLMGLNGPLSPGERVVLVLRFSDGSTQTVRALVKDFTGADEQYAGGGTSGTGMSGMGSGTDGDS